jgi:hypothetical protein
MKNRMSAKPSKRFLFLALGFSMLFSPLVGEAQNNSAFNLAGTEWNTGEYEIPTSNDNNSVTTLTHYLVFYKQSKVKDIVIREKSAGRRYTSDYEYVYDYVTNPITGQQEYKQVYKKVPKTVTTMPSFIQRDYEGTYEMRGKSVFMNFPSFTISATIYSNSLKGVITHKDTNEKEERVFTRTINPNSSSSGARSSSNSSSSSRANKTPSPSAAECYVFQFPECKPFPHSGTYSGEWSVSGTFPEEHTGSWTFSIDIKGIIEGRTHDNVSGRNAEISGFIDENGYLEVSCKYPNTIITTIKGTLTKKGDRLTGTLKQYSGDTVIATLSTELSKR